MSLNEQDEDQLLRELAVFVADIGPCADLPALAAASCQTKAERWLLGQILAASLVGPVADALGYLVGSDCVASQLAEWAEAFAAELPTPWDLTAVDFTAAVSDRALGPARVALHEAVVTTSSDACERRAVDLARDGLIGLPSWSFADLRALSGTPELREKLAGWFLSGLAERVSQLLRGCGLLLQWRAKLVPDEELPTLPAMTKVVVAVSSVASESVAAATCLVHDSAALRCFYSSRSPVPGADATAAREQLSALAVAAFDAAFRRVESADPSLQLRPLWRLAVGDLLWSCWAEIQGLKLLPPDGIAASFADRFVAPLLTSSAGGTAEPRKTSKRNRRAKARGAGASGAVKTPASGPEATEQPAEMKTTASGAQETTEDAGNMHGFAREADLHDWNRRSVEMMIRMGWSMDEVGLG